MYACAVRNDSPPNGKRISVQNPPTLASSPLLSGVGKYYFVEVLVDATTRVLALHAPNVYVRMDRTRQGYGLSHTNLAYSSDEPNPTPIAYNGTVKGRSVFIKKKLN